MAATRRSFAFALVLTIAGLRPCLGQDTAAPAAPPQLAAGDMESFLQNAKIMATKSTKKGVTSAKRVTLSDGRVTHDAQIQDVDLNGRPRRVRTDRVLLLSRSFIQNHVVEPPGHRSGLAIDLALD